jgi:hypothetical protein
MHTRRLMMSPERFGIISKAFCNANPHAYILTIKASHREEWEADIKKVEALIEADNLNPRKVEAILMDIDRLPLGDFIIYDEGAKEAVLAEIKIRVDVLLIERSKHHDAINKIDGQVTYLKRMESRL